MFFEKKLLKLDCVLEIKVDDVVFIGWIENCIEEFLEVCFDDNVEMFKNWLEVYY